MVKSLGCKKVMDKQHSFYFRDSLPDLRHPEVTEINRDQDHQDQNQEDQQI